MIRKMIEADLAQVADLENICFPKGGWTLEQFRYELLENPFSNLLVFEENQMNKHSLRILRLILLVRNKVLDNNY